ncbi:MAG TPA: spore coat U domain-containing protein [Rhizomicrobium sp.]
MRMKTPGRVWCLSGSAALFLASTITPALAAECGTGINPILVVATGAAFGNYSPSSGTPATTNGTITLTCTVVLLSTLPSFTVSLSASTSGQINPRQMSFGAARLNYNLFTTASYTTIWGNGTAPTVTQSYASGDNLVLKTFTVYGRIPAGQVVAVGLYTDSLTVTITY